MFRTSPKTRLGELLVCRRLISQAQLEQALSLQKQHGDKLGLILIQQGWITRQQLRQALTQQRFQHLTASLLLTCGTFFSPLAKIVAAQTVVPVVETQSSKQQEPTVLPQSVAVAPSWYQPPRLQRPVEVDAMPLAAHPSESAPLIGFCHPLRGYGLISQGFHGLSHQGRMEYAMDIQVSMGTPVYALRSGRVVGLEDRFADDGGGPDKIREFNYALIEHQGNYRSAYLHLQQGFLAKAGIKVGDYVTAGQLIGYSGNSGWSTGPHLHVEIEQRSKPGTLGQTVPFKLGRACESTPSVVVATEDTPNLTRTTSSVWISSKDRQQSQEAADELQPEACSSQGCGCVTCAGGKLAGNSRFSTSSDSTELPVLLSNRLSQLLLR